MKLNDREKTEMIIATTQAVSELPDDKLIAILRMNTYAIILNVLTLEILERKGQTKSKRAKSVMDQSTLAMFAARAAVTETSQRKMQPENIVAQPIPDVDINTVMKDLTGRIEEILIERGQPPFVGSHSLN